MDAPDRIDGRQGAAAPSSFLVLLQSLLLAISNFLARPFGAQGRSDRANSNSGDDGSASTHGSVASTPAPAQSQAQTRGQVFPAPSEEDSQGFIAAPPRHHEETGSHPPLTRRKTPSLSPSPPPQRSRRGATPLSFRNSPSPSPSPPPAPVSPSLRQRSSPRRSPRFSSPRSSPSLSPSPPGSPARMPASAAVDSPAASLRSFGPLSHVQDHLASPQSSPSQTPADARALERKMNHVFMSEALDMARLALKTNETPVGCVLVYKNRVIARGMNATNVTRNGTRHAELMALSALLSYAPQWDTDPAGPKGISTFGQDDAHQWGDVDPSDGHIFPYGQKLHPSPRVDQSIVSECILYVTVEPCVMCASLLRQLHIKKVYFGAVNDKFGGTGGVFHVHKNSPQQPTSTSGPEIRNGLVVRPSSQRKINPAATSSVSLRDPNEADAFDEASLSNEDSHIIVVDDSIDGDGGNVERGYPVEGGWGRDEAVTLLRQFYVQENNRAPVPRKKEGRAARLQAMMQRDGHGGGSTGSSNEANDSPNSSNTPNVGCESPAQNPTCNLPEPVALQNQTVPVTPTENSNNRENVPLRTELQDKNTSPSAAETSKPLSV